MPASDDFKKEMLKCLNGQDEFSEFASSLKTAIVHDLPALGKRADKSEETLREIEKQVSNFGETNTLLKKVSEGIGEVNISIAEMAKDSKHSLKDFERLEGNLNDMGLSIRVQIKALDDRAREETIKVNARLAVLETKQGGIIATASKVIPWLITFAYVVYNQITKS